MRRIDRRPVPPMDCDYWRDIVAKLSDVRHCNWAAHVLSAGLLGPGADTHNLGEALRCAGRDEVVTGVIRAYRDPASRTYCDLILARFDADEVLSAYLNVGDPDDEIRAGVLDLFKEADAAEAGRPPAASDREG